MGIDSVDGSLPLSVPGALTTDGAGVATGVESGQVGAGPAANPASPVPMTLRSYTSGFDTGTTPQVYAQRLGGASQVAQAPQATGQTQLAQPAVGTVTESRGVKQGLPSGATALGTDATTRQALESLRRSPTAEKMIDKLGNEHSTDVKATLRPDWSPSGSAGGTNTFGAVTTINVFSDQAKCEQYHDEQGKPFLGNPERTLAHEVGHAYIEKYGDTEHLRDSFLKSHPDVKEVNNFDLAVLYENKIARELDSAAPVRFYKHENPTYTCLPQ